MSKKVYVILGASSDIGRNYIKSLVSEQEEYLVISQYHTSYKLLQEECGNLPNVQLVPLCCDLSKSDEVNEFIKQVDEICTCPDAILMVAASKLKLEKLKAVSWEALQQDMEIQIHSSISILQHILPLMAKKKYGRIVFLLSSCTLGTPPKFMTSYTVSKYALLGLMKSLATEYAGKGITINAISPNMIQTRFLENLDERTVEMIADNSILKRHIKIEEVVRTIHFLLSDYTECISGVNFNLTGGEKM